MFQWKEAMFLGMWCLEYGPFRIMPDDDGGYSLFVDRKLSTEVHKCRSLVEAQRKAEEILDSFCV
jgi:hypothetical protein